MNHAATLCHCADFDCFSANLDFISLFLGLGICCHDCLHGIQIALSGNDGSQCRNALFDGLDRKHLPDDTGRGYDDILRLQMQCFCCQNTHFLRLFHAVCIAGVRIAAVADNCLRHAVRDVSSGYGDGCAENLILCINRCCCAGLFAVNDSNILFCGIVCFYATMHPAGKKALGCRDTAVYLLHSISSL